MAWLLTNILWLFACFPQSLLPGLERNQLDRLSELLKHTFQTNVQLTSRVEELERELSVWKNAYTSRERQESEILKKNEDMKRYILGLQVRHTTNPHYLSLTDSPCSKDDYPINMALIDGDGNIFSSELLQQGAVGGRQVGRIGYFLSYS